MIPVAIIFTLVLVAQLSGANVDSPFAVDPDEVQLREISDNVRRVSGAVMGLTEYVMEIRNELKTIRTDIYESKAGHQPNTTMRPLTYYSGKPQRDPEEVRRQSLILADKVEKLLAMDHSPEVDLAKEELKRTVEKNFLRMLAAILVTGPVHTQERSDDIFKLMRSVLNGELDFTPVVQRLPFILRDSETNQFVNLLITLRESERGGPSFRQEGLLSSVENTAQMSGRKQVLNFPIPSSPLGGIPNNRPINPINPNLNRPINPINPNLNRPINPINPNLNRPINPINANLNRPIINNNNRPLYANPNYQNNNNYQPNLHQQPNINPNINNNRIPPPNNVNTVNTNNNNNVNNGQLNGSENGSPQGAPGQNGQNPQLPTINSIIDAMNHTNQLIEKLPSLVEGLQTLIESLEGVIG